MMTVSSSRVRLLIVCLGLAILGMWRGWGLAHRGLLEHDEGHNLLAARTYGAVLGWIATGGPLRSDASDLATLRDELHRQGGTLYPAGKPGYVALLAVASLPDGVSQEWALWLSWIAGMLCIIAVPWILREWNSASWVGCIVAMVGVGMSPLVGALSREVGGVIWALAFGLWGFWCLLRSGNLGSERRRKAQWMAYAGGILLGIGFTCHYNLLPLLLAAFVSDAVWQWGNPKSGSASTSQPHPGKIRQWCLRSLWTVAGGMTVFLVVQTATTLGEIRLRSVYPEYRNYASELIAIVSTFQIPALVGNSVGEGVRGWGMEAWGYVSRIALREGFLAVLVAIACLGTAIVRIPRGDRRLASPLAFLGVMFLFWLLHPWKVERSWGMLVAGLSLVSGCVVSEWMSATRSTESGWKRGDRIILIVLTLVVLLHAIQVGGGSWTTLWRQQSPIPGVVRETLDYVKRNGGSIQANSASKSFAPLWKWAVVEEGKRPDLRAALDSVDFSRFETPDIVFVDPRTWKDADFPSTPGGVEVARIISIRRNETPSWTVSSHDLRLTSRQDDLERPK